MTTQQTFKHHWFDDMNSTTENSQIQIDVVNAFLTTLFLYLLVELHNDYILFRPKFDVVCGIYFEHVNNADKKCCEFTNHSKSEHNCNVYHNHKLRMSVVHSLNDCNNRTNKFWMKSNCKRSCFDFKREFKHADNHKMIWAMCDEWYSNAKSSLKYSTKLHKLSKNFSLCFKSFIELSSNKNQSNQCTLQYVCI